MVLPEDFLEFIPGDALRIFRYSAEVVPPLSCCSNELVSFQKDFIPSSSMNDIQLLIDFSKPIIGLEGVFNAVKGWWFEPYKF